MPRAPLNRTQKLASLYMQKWGFNKFNAPELMSQLVAVLEREGLDEVLEVIRSSRLPHKLDEAWRNRNRVGSDQRLMYLQARTAVQEKYAGDIRRVLGPMFEPVQPFVKDYDRFLKKLASDISFEWDSILGLGDSWAAADFKIVSWDEGTWTGEQVGGYGMGDPDDPPEYEQERYEYPSLVQMVCTVSLPLRTFPRRMAVVYRPFLKDPKGFMRALTGITTNTTTLTMLGKLLATGSRSVFKGDPGAFIMQPGVYNSLKDFGEDLAQSKNPGFQLDWSPSERVTKVNRSWFKVTGQGIDISLNVHVGGSADATPLESEPGYGPGGWGL